VGPIGLLSDAVSAAIARELADRAPPGKAAGVNGGGSSEEDIDVTSTKFPQSDGKTYVRWPRQTCVTSPSGSRSAPTHAI
jgi:hypothetical protein